MRNLIFFMILLVATISCKKEIDNLKEIDKVTAPTNVSAVFDITQDNTGTVTIMPTAEGVTAYKIKFGDVADEVATEYSVNEEIIHVYAEGTYNVEITGVGLSGLTSSVTKELNVTFKAPEDLVVTITQDELNPAVVSVIATATYATIMDIYFGDVAGEEPVHALPEEEVTHTYAEAGDYIIRVVAKSAGTATTEFSDTITVTPASDPVYLPIDFESFTVNYSFTDFGGVISQVFDNPEQSGINTSDKVAQLVKESGAETWGGSYLTIGEPIDFSTKQIFEMKFFSPKEGVTVRLKVENIDNPDYFYEVDAVTTVVNEWEELTFDFSGIDQANTYQKLVVFPDFGVMGDDVTYYYDDVVLTSSTPGGGIVGTWKMKPVAGSLGVGPDYGDISWWAIDDAGVIERACFFDDAYVFGSDGSFSNEQGGDTWLEAWQGMDPDGCGVPVAPHNGSNSATYTFDEGAGTVTLNGVGAYLGIPKVINDGELTSPDDAPESITYQIILSDDGSEMTLDISIGTGWWRFILVKEGGGVSSPLEGSWSMDPVAGSFGVGPELGDMSWWAIDDAGVTERACFFDDEYVFGADGSFSNVLGSETWVEDWQGGTNSCGVPVAPHDGSATATFVYDEGAGTVTLNGVGAFLGIPKAYNGGELTSPDEAPESITYDIQLSDDNMSMTLDINIGGGWWRFILVKN
jgi:hypothetical protein